MQQIKANISAITDTVATAMNPFTRLVNAATERDGTSGISYYQSEQIKEASHQSDYGCEMVHKALCARLDQLSPLIQYKALWLIRLLLLEGPGSFSERMSGMSGGQVIARIHHLGTQMYPYAEKNSIEESTKNLAHAVHAAITGAGHSALMNIEGVPGTNNANNTNNNSNNSGGAGQQKFKSAFHQEQVKELRNWRKRREEERKSGTVLADKNTITFNNQLSAGKLVESVLQAEKKKFATEEVFSFVEALVANTKPSDVCAMMDKVIADVSRYNIAQRHKMLQMVEGVVMTQGLNENTGAISEIGSWWEAHTTNLTKCTTLDDMSNPGKAKLIQEISKRVLEHLTVLSTNPSQAASASNSMFPSPEQQKTAPSNTSNNNNLGINDPNYSAVASPGVFSTTSVGSDWSTAPAPVDPLFGGMQQKDNKQRSRGPSQTQQQQQRSRGSSTATSSTTDAAQPAKKTGGNTWQPSFGVTNINPIFAMDSNDNNNQQSGGDIFGGLNMKQKAQQQPAIVVPPLATATTSATQQQQQDPQAMMKSLQAQFEQNMKMMAALQQQQQQGGTSANNNNTAPQQEPQQEQQAAPSSWGASVFAPPPIPEQPKKEKSPEPQQQQQEEDDNEQQDEIQDEGEATETIEPRAQSIPSVNNSFTNISPLANSTSASGTPAVPNNSFVDPNNAMMNTAALQQQMQQMQNAMIAQQQQVQQPAQQQQQPPLMKQQPPSRTTSQNNLSLAGSVNQQQQLHQQGGGGGGEDTPRSAVSLTRSTARSSEDAELISLLRQQLSSAQQQIAQQNQMMSMMQQQIQMLMGGGNIKSNSSKKSSSKTTNKKSTPAPAPVESSSSSSASASEEKNEENEEREVEEEVEAEGGDL